MLVLLAQQRQAGAGLLQRRLQCQHLAVRCLAQAQSLAGQLPLRLLRFHDVLQRADLRCQPRLRDGGLGNAGDQVQACGFELVALVVGARAQGLQRTAVAAGQVERVAHADAGAVLVEGAPFARQALRTGRDALAPGARSRVHARQLGGAGLRGLQLLCLAQGGFGAGQGRAGGQGLVDERVQRWRSQLLPPGRGQIHAGGELLRLAQRSGG